MAQNGRVAGGGRMAVNGRAEEREFSGHPSKSEDLNYRVRCEYCGNELRRLARQGFMQTKIYSRFGYYPWECPLCREPMLVKQQHRLKRESSAEPEVARAVAAGNGAAGGTAKATQSNGHSSPTRAVTERKPAESTLATMVESEREPMESEPTIVERPKTNADGFQLTAMEAVDQKPARSKATRARAAGSSGARPKVTRAQATGSNGTKPRSRTKKAVPVMTEQPAHGSESAQDRELA